MDLLRHRQQAKKIFSGIVNVTRTGEGQGMLT